MHLRMVQEAEKPLFRIDLNNSIVMCLRDSRHVDYKDSSFFEAVQVGLNDGSIYFQYYHNFIVRLRDGDILDSIVIHVKIHGFRFKEGNHPISIYATFVWLLTFNNLIFLGFEDVDPSYEYDAPKGSYFEILGVLECLKKLEKIRSWPP